MSHTERLSAAEVGEAVLSYAATFDHLGQPHADQLDAHRAAGQRLYGVLASIGLEDVAIDMGLTAPDDEDARARTP